MRAESAIGGVVARLNLPLQFAIAAGYGLDEHCLHIRKVLSKHGMEPYAGLLGLGSAERIDEIYACADEQLSRADHHRQHVHDAQHLGLGLQTVVDRLDELRVALLADQQTDIRPGQFERDHYQQGGDGKRGDAVVADVGLLLEGCAAIRVPDPLRTKQLRRRYLAQHLDGLSRRDVDSLPGPPPSDGELNWRWQR